MLRAKTHTSTYDEFIKKAVVNLRDLTKPCPVSKLQIYLNISEIKKALLERVEQSTFDELLELDKAMKELKVKEDDHFFSNKLKKQIKKRCSDQNALAFLRAEQLDYFYKQKKEDFLRCAKNLNAENRKIVLKTITLLESKAASDNKSYFSLSGAMHYLSSFVYAENSIKKDFESAVSTNSNASAELAKEEMDSRSQSDDKTPASSAKISDVNENPKIPVDAKMAASNVDISISEKNEKQDSKIDFLAELDKLLLDEKERFECPSSLELFHKPLMPPCGHYYEEDFALDNFKKVAGEGKSDRVDCYMCRLPFSIDQLFYDEIAEDAVKSFEMDQAKLSSLIDKVEFKEVIAQYIQRKENRKGKFPETPDLNLKRYALLSLPPIPQALYLDDPVYKDLTDALKAGREALHSISLQRSLLISQITVPDQITDFNSQIQQYRQKVIDFNENFSEKKMGEKKIAQEKSNDEQKKQLDLYRNAALVSDPRRINIRPVPGNVMPDVKYPDEKKHYRNDSRLSQAIILKINTLIAGYARDNQSCCVFFRSRRSDKRAMWQELKIYVDQEENAPKSLSQCVDEMIKRHPDSVKGFFSRATWNLLNEIRKYEPSIELFQPAKGLEFRPSF